MVPTIHFINFLPSRLSKNEIIKIYKTIILPVFLYRRGTLFLTLWGEQTKGVWGQGAKENIWRNCIMRSFISCKKKLSLMPWTHMGEWRYSSTFLDLGTRWRWMVSFTPGERAFSTHWIGGWVGPGVRLDAVEKGNILHYRESNPGRPARRYIDWAIPTRL
jgi:hypothetical protein